MTWEGVVPILTEFAEGKAHLEGMSKMKNSI
jgi:hypothetical protein